MRKTRPFRAQAPESDLIPLDAVIQQVTSALARYQASLGTGANALPPLKSAVFDFKTTVERSSGFSINLLIFTIGGSKQSDVVNEVTFSYAVPRAAAAASGKRGEPASVEDELLATIQGAARAVASGAGAVGSAPLSQLAITLQYGVKRGVDAGGRAQISLVTVGLKGDKDVNAVQSLKLVFAE